MPDTPIDLSEGIQSVRLKVPTAEVPIPPEGFAQLHSPAPGELALRLPDGSVVPVGGGGTPQTALHNPYGSQVNLDGTDPTIGVLFGIAPGQQWVIDPPVSPVDIYRKPLGVQVATVTISSAELLAMDAVPKVLIEAIAGQLIVPVSAAIRAVPGGTPYTGAAELWLGHLSPVPGNGVLPGNTDTMNGGPIPPNMDHFFGNWVSQEQAGYPIVGVPFAAQLGAPVAAGDGSMRVAVAYLVV